MQYCFLFIIYNTKKIFSEQWDFNIQKERKQFKNLYLQKILYNFWN